MPPGEQVVVYLPGVAWDAVKGTDRHLAEQLGRRVPVVWVDPPLSVVHRDQAPGESLRAVTLSRPAPGVTRVTYLAPPFPGRRWVRGATHVWGRALVRRALDRLGVVPAAVVNTSPVTDFDLVPAPRGRRLYYATDDFVAGAALMGVSEDLLRTHQDRRIRQADLLAGVSQEIVDGWTVDRPRVVLPNGCDVDAFAAVDEVAPAPDVRLAGPVVGLFGQVSSRLDLELLEAVNDAGVDLLVVGPAVRTLDRERFDALVSRPGVQWTGPRPFESLPAYARCTTLGLTPYRDTAFNRASYPLKTLEYLAAGRRVLSTPLPAVTALGSPDVHTATGPRDFAAAAVRLAAAADRDDDRARRRRFAAQHSWERRAETLLDLLGLELGASHGRPRPRPDAR